FEYDRVVQHTYVDYTWTSQLTVRFDRRLETGAHVFASGSGGLVGADPAALNRNRQSGGRAEGGLRVSTQHAAADVYVAYERRVEGHAPLRPPSSWLEFGFRTGPP